MINTISKIKHLLKDSDCLTGYHKYEADDKACFFSFIKPVAEVKPQVFRNLRSCIKIEEIVDI